MSVKQKDSPSSKGLILLKRTPATKYLRLPAVIVGLSASLLSGCATQGRVSATETNAVQLARAIGQVNKALDYYRDHRSRGNKDPLPDLSQADFDFRTSTMASGGVSASGLWVFTLSASAERDTMNEVTYTYKKPPKPKGFFALELTPPTLEQQLIDTIRSAADAVQESRKVGDLPFDSLKVVIQFGYKFTGKAGLGFPVELVTIGANAEYDRSTVQSVTLTFAPPS